MLIRRLRGLFVIVRALLPVLLVLGLVIATWVTSRAIVDATRDYGERLSTQLEAIEAAVDEANEGLEAIGGFVLATAGAADTLLGQVAELRDTVSIPLPRVEIPDFEIPVINRTINLPDFNLGDGSLDIPIPGLGPIKDLASELTEAGRKVTDPITSVAALADVPPQLEAAAADTAVYADDIRSTMLGWLRVILALLLVAGSIWIIAAARPMLSELSRGWSMLRGRPSAERSVAKLERRVKELERQVAAIS